MEQYIVVIHLAELLRRAMEHIPHQNVVNNRLACGLLEFSNRKTGDQPSCRFGFFFAVSLSAIFAIS